MCSRIIGRNTSLNVLQLSSLTLPNTIYLPTLRKLQLKRVHLRGGSQFPSMLRHMNNLEALVLLGQLPECGLVSSLSENLPLNLPRLCALALSPLYDILDAHLIRLLDCPKLTALHLQDDDSPWDTTLVPNIMAAIEEQAWKLEELTFDCVLGAENIMMVPQFLLRQATDVRRLAISAELYAMARQTHGPNPFPAVKDLGLRLEWEHMHLLVGTPPEAHVPIVDDPAPVGLTPKQTPVTTESPPSATQAKMARLGIAVRELLCDDRRVYLYGPQLYKPSRPYQPSKDFNLLRSESRIPESAPVQVQEVYLGQAEWMY
ncbi:hypothetical protein CALVIDRAFT_569780 [Calocera viscosa TUFC12733]|uniref:F-box domain-containing protein n=1 Tax=Calocera viscosa (strain TUFC12733) TaxID=1330018 RepID=A0A167FKV9_CALVF|nr:hypothetical protein CALVIDRAFT_569780 [Calocera viscosa TUFC12733]